jgi:hypothetical protein
MSREIPEGLNARARKGSAKLDGGVSRTRPVACSSLAAQPRAEMDREGTRTAA